MTDQAEIDRRFIYRAPTDETRAKHESVDISTRDLARHLNDLLSDSREKSLALTALQECRMRANAAIATALPQAKP